MDNFSDMVINQCMPKAMENLIQMTLTIWNADKIYIILFLLFIIFYVKCNHWIKHHKKYHQ